MSLQTGEVVDLHKGHAPVAGCTVSSELIAGDQVSLTCFSLAEHTDISAESYPTDALYLGLSGEVQVTLPDGAKPRLREGSVLAVPANQATGFEALQDAVYLEVRSAAPLALGPELEAGQAYELPDLAPYGSGQIVNRDIAKSDHLKLMVMAFDQGTGLSPHRAPGQAVVFALDGEAIIGYEGEEHRLHAGEQFSFAKGALHSVTAVTPFRMALLLALQ
ncbi:cupin domain-containing protein [Olsenella sp. YH-ols2217]|uniref:Cupin domain-containing protein n=1 Tax=Kribbibacterium absianum TaxID=3044210 RepID=A0ABT6ZKF8_9ACTN|nr:MULTISPECIES: cupin domain-containing protein [unclassified Olsenella]MDJ1122505.1 cupin domain-containing protein [Olsenella sp. YH-ols2216]MDJ1129535.1 cupin domain-containing protein [Olsenella sp. YH-ols2217]